MARVNGRHLLAESMPQESTNWQLKTIFREATPAGQFEAISPVETVVGRPFRDEDFVDAQ